MPRRRFNTSQFFKSNARVIYISQFHEGKASFENLNGSFEDGWVWEAEKGFWPQMPVILTSNGTPWELGSAYLLYNLTSSFRAKMDTIQDRAKSLCFYLKFIEDECLDLLFFPSQERKRPTYRFRYKLEQLMDLGMPPSTARKHMGHVIAFYKGIVQYNLVDEDLLGRRPFRSFKKYVQTLSAEGLIRHKQVDSTDLVVRVQKISSRPDRIMDGNELRPLDIDEQRAIYWGFEKKLCSIETELMMRIILDTGMRIQSVCTLRVGHIIDAYEELERNKEKWIFIHSQRGRFTVDTKYSKANNFRFSKALIERLYVYINSETSIARREASYYHKSHENYVFLTEQSNPFYTSRGEIHHRQSSDSHWSLIYPDFKPQKGNTFRANMRNFIRRIKVYKPELNDFSVHDLRATHGMNIVRKLAGDKEKRFNTSQIELAVKFSLNHSNISTSRLYVNFDEALLEQFKLNELYENSVLDGYKTIDEIYGGESL